MAPRPRKSKFGDPVPIEAHNGPLSDFLAPRRPKVPPISNRYLACADPGSCCFPSGEGVRNDVIDHAKVRPRAGIGQGTFVVR